MKHSLDDQEKAAADSGDGAIHQLLAARDAALQAARAAVRDTTRLTRLLAILSEPGPINVLLDRALTTLSELFLAEIIILLDPVGTGSFVPVASVGLPESIAAEPFSYGDDHILHHLLQGNQPMVIEESLGLDQLDHRFGELDASLVAAVPVAGENTVRGALFVARCRPAPFPEAEIDLLATMAYRVGLALEDAQRKSQLEAIIQSGNSIGRHLNLEVITQDAAKQFRVLAGAESSALVLRHPSGEFYCAASDGIGENDLHRLPGLAGELIAKKSVSAEKVYSPGLLLQPSAHSPLSMDHFRPTVLAIPLHQNKECSGILLAFRSIPLAFDQITGQMGMLYANYVSAAIDNACLFAAGQKELLERIRAEDALRASDNRFRALVRSVSDIIAILSPQGSIMYVSPAAEQFWSCPAAALHGESVFNLLSGEDRQLFSTFLEQAMRIPHTGDVNGIIRFQRRDGLWRSFEVTLVNLASEPAVNGVVATFHDVTERSLYERELTKLAFQDPLTGLANRTHFTGCLAKGLRQASKLGQRVAVIFFDLDNFKHVNDSLGHDCGDKVLQIIADRIRACLRKEDTAARLGGDEFTLLIEGLSAIEQVLPMADRLLCLLHEPIGIDGHAILVGGSMGIALSQPYRDDSESMLRKADEAMYEAKNSGKGCFRVYADESEQAPAAWQK